MDLNGNGGVEFDEFCFMMYTVSECCACLALPIAVMSECMSTVMVCWRVADVLQVAKKFHIWKSIRRFNEKEYLVANGVSVRLDYSFLAIW